MLYFNKTVHEKFQVFLMKLYKLTVKLYLTAKCQYNQDTLKNNKKARDLPNIKTY